MDPINGFSKMALKDIPFQNFRLSLAKARMVDYVMEAKYADEVSNFSVSRVLFSFSLKYLMRLFKRICYPYFLQDFNFGSLSTHWTPYLYSGESHWNS